MQKERVNGDGMIKDLFFKWLEKRLIIKWHTNYIGDFPRVTINFNDKVLGERQWDSLTYRWFE